MSRTPAIVAAALMMMSLFVGCTNSTPIAREVPSLDVQGSAAFGTFLKQNEAVLNPSKDIAALYSFGDTVYAYTADNTVYSLSGGLDIRYVVQVADADEKVRAPVVLNNETIFPTSTGLQVFTSTGASVRSVVLRDPLTSNVRPDGKGNLVAGTAAPTGGMMSVINPTKLVRPVTQRVLIGSVLSAPVVVQGTVFAATQEGGVYAIDPQITPARAVWGLDHMRFTTGNQVTADLVADEYGVFVASTDTKLYALDRATGRIKWRFLAESPLRQTPLVTKDRVFQIIPGKGLAAISKTDEAEYHSALWMADGVTSVLSTDDKYVYAIQGRDRLVAIDLVDGKVKFSVAGRFDYFIAGPDNKIYAATKGGAVVAFQRGTFTGNDMATAR